MLEFSIFDEDNLSPFFEDIEHIFESHILISVISLTYDCNFTHIVGTESQKTYYVCIREYMYSPVIYFVELVLYNHNFKSDIDYG